jgi:peptidoglycan hydrolase CwlO-like protein
MYDMTRGHKHTGCLTVNFVLSCLQSLEKQLQQIDLTLEENGGRIGVMDEHLKNVQQEITYTESRVSAANNSIWQKCRSSG